EIGEWRNHGVGGGVNNRKNDGDFVIMDLLEHIKYFVLPCLQFSNPMSSSQIIKRKYSLTLSIATLKSLLLFSPYSATTTTTTMTITTNFTKMIDENCWLTRAEPVLLLNNLIKLFDQRKLLLTSSISITLVEDIYLLIEELSRLLTEYFTSLPQDYDQNSLCLIIFLKNYH